MERDTGTPLPTAEAISELRFLIEYAYGAGYKPKGYDPLEVVEKALENAREFVADNWRHEEGLKTALCDLGADPTTVWK